MVRLRGDSRYGQHYFVLSWPFEDPGPSIPSEVGNQFSQVLVGSYMLVLYNEAVRSAAQTSTVGLNSPTNSLFKRYDSSVNTDIRISNGDDSPECS